MARTLPYDSGVILFGDLPEDDPNTTPPAAARIFTPDRGGSFDVVDSQGVQAVAEYTDGASPTVTLTPWVRNHDTGRWHSRTPITLFPADRLDDITNLGNAQVFFQLTAPAGAFTNVRIRAVVLR